MPEVEERYGNGGRNSERFSMWTLNYPAHTVSAGETLRIYLPSSFRLRYSFDNWAQVHDIIATATELSIHFVDLRVPRDQRAPVRFTFFRSDDAKWQGCDYSVTCKSDSN